MLVIAASGASPLEFAKPHKPNEAPVVNMARTDVGTAALPTGKAVDQTEMPIERDGELR
jgi:hypothetical protein